jgi:hypothetical protein
MAPINTEIPMTRRLALFAALLPALSFAAEPAAPPAPAPKAIAILANVWNDKCHAHAIASKYFTGFPTDEGLIAPEVRVAAIYIDQASSNDVGRKLAASNGIPVYATVAGALCLGGTNLAVDGVLYIGEHGDYPRSRMGVKMYPRLRILEQVFQVFDAAGRSVPVFNDKHLAYSWLDSKWIYDRARELDVPLMAGSVIPLTWRRPALEHPPGAPVTEAVAVGYGPLDAYGFHPLEGLQAMLERRAGGETGVQSIQCLTGTAVFAAIESGAVSADLIDAACAGAKKRKPTLKEGDASPILILIAYRDGTRGALLMTKNNGEYWGYAARVEGGIKACEFVAAPKPAYAYFSYLGLNAQRMFVTGKAVWPAERTLLTSGILDTAFRSLTAGGRLIETPFLDIRYQPAAEPPLRPLGEAPAGTSLEAWPPPGFGYLEAGR